MFLNKKKYFDYQMKLVKLLRLYDEEIPMRMIFDKILTETPDNLRIIVEREWLNFSESVDKYFLTINLSQEIKLHRESITSL